MKKMKLWMVVLVGIVFFSSNLFARISLVTGEKSGQISSGTEQSFDKPCPLLGYKKISCPTGQFPQDFCPGNERYFSSCACDLNYYKYSEQNCDTSKQVLSGATCLSGEITLYRDCRCKSAFKFCKEGAFHSSVACVDEEGTKYAICNEDIPTCESIGHLSAQPAGQRCQEISNDYMKCYIASTCTQI